MAQWSTPAERRQMLEQRREGKSFGRIGREWGYSRSGVLAMVRNAEDAERRAKRDRDQIELDRQQRERLGTRPVGPHELPGPRITPRRRWFR